MRYFMRFDTGFLIEADDHSEAMEKGWEFVYENLPKCFDTECSEMSYFNLDNKGENEE